MRILFDPLIRDLGFDFNGYCLEVFLARGAHDALNFFGYGLSFTGVGFDNNLVVNDVDDFGAGLA